MRTFGIDLSLPPQSSGAGTSWPIHQFPWRKSPNNESIAYHWTRRNDPLPLDEGVRQRFEERVERLHREPESVQCWVVEWFRNARNGRKRRLILQMVKDLEEDFEW